MDNMVAGQVQNMMYRDDKRRNEWYVYFAVVMHYLEWCNLTFRFRVTFLSKNFIYSCFLVNDVFVLF